MYIIYMSDVDGRSVFEKAKMLSHLKLIKKVKSRFSCLIDRLCCSFTFERRREIVNIEIHPPSPIAWASNKSPPI